MKKLLVILLLLYPLTAQAEMYQWTDGSGTVNFAEGLGSVPKKYRKKAKVVGGEEEAPAPRAAAPASDSDKPKGEEQKSAKKLYGGKDEAGWRREFLKANSDLENAQLELSTLQGRLADTSKMSRSEYLAIQNSIRHAETRLQTQQRRFDELREKADRLDVPAEYRK
ncbi:MAG TPA: DUF4124 domain-containing protein [Geobacter sp.]|nr:DUF4124 domain-containing protein [Geobacter sp.]